MELTIEAPRGHRFKDISGQQFGRLSVKGFAGFGKRRLAWWECVCSCGAVVTVCGNNLRTGNSHSCGCARTEAARSIFTKHGDTNSAEYIAWGSMKARCTNPNLKNQHRYIGRGITMCERWRDFSNFLSDMGRKPSPELSLDRIDNDGNYEPDNCRWGTGEQQANNRSTNRMISFSGETLTVAEWGRRLGVPARVIYSRLHSGWSPDRALSTPI